MTTRELVIFAKEPAPGKVKTRLAQAIGAESAAGLYARFVDLILRRCTSTCAEWATVLALAPDDALSRLGTILPNCAPIPKGVTVRPQGGGDLGARLESAVSIAWAAGVRQVILIGSDNPDLMAPDIQEGFAALEETDAVIGPTDDGGYYLLGLRASPSGLVGQVFRGIDWSTERVFEQTLRSLCRDGLSYTTLVQRRDVDTYDDLAAMSQTADVALRDILLPRVR